jgi:hypothetical protein
MRRALALSAVLLATVAVLAACGSDDSLGTPVAERETTTTDASSPTTESTTTTGADGSATGASCYAGTYRMQPVTSTTFTTRSGGDGATLVVAADGTFTIDLSTMTEWVAVPTVDPTMENHVQFGGRVTGSLVLPDGEGAATIGAWDPSGVTGQAESYLGGQLLMTMDAETANAIAQAAFGNPDGTWTVTPCDPSGFAFSNSGIDFAWSRA